MTSAQLHLYMKTQWEKYLAAWYLCFPPMWKQTHTARKRIYDESEVFELF